MSDEVLQTEKNRVLHPPREMRLDGDGGSVDARSLAPTVVLPAPGVVAVEIAEFESVDDWAG